MALLQREERAQEAEVGAALVDRVAAEDELRAGCELERVEVLGSPPPPLTMQRDRPTYRDQNAGWPST